MFSICLRSSLPSLGQYTLLVAQAFKVLAQNIASAAVGSP